MVKTTSSFITFKWLDYATSGIKRSKDKTMKKSYSWNFEMAWDTYEFDDGDNFEQNLQAIFYKGFFFRKVIELRILNTQRNNLRFLNLIGAHYFLGSPFSRLYSSLVHSFYGSLCYFHLPETHGRTECAKLMAVPIKK